MEILKKTYYEMYLVLCTDRQSKGFVYIQTYFKLYVLQWTLQLNWKS